MARDRLKNWGEFMKKYISLCVAICLSFLFSGCDLFLDSSVNYNESGSVNGLYIAINRKANCCFVGQYDCSEYTENAEIIIPDEYDGVPVTKIGGYYGVGVPSPFRIELGDAYMNAPSDSDFYGVFSGNLESYGIEEEYSVEELVFTLRIGKNISEIEFVSMGEYYPHINDDGSITFYHPVVNVVCSEENKSFYSKDGKLYNKETDELIEEFNYAQ